MKTRAGRASLMRIVSKVIMYILLPILAPTLEADNRPPIFNPVSDQAVIEGKTLLLSLSADDPEGHEVEYSALRLPPGATLNTESGQFRWTPPFSGPYSSASSPLSFVFIASDGDASSELSIVVEVLNFNRPPVVDIPASFTVNAADSVSVDISAYDPDYDELEVELEGLPDDAVLVQGASTRILWRTTLADSGDYQVQVRAFDPYGLSDEGSMSLSVLYSSVCELDISDIQVLGGRTGVVDVNLANRVAIESMRLLIKYDQSALTLLSVSQQGTRVDGWQRYMTTVIADDGRVWLDAGAGGEFLEPGEGIVMKMNFLLTSDQNFAGQLVPIRFEFLDDLSELDNVFIDSDSNRIGQDLVEYFGGSVFIRRYLSPVGDINLNAVPFEIGDIVYFTNYFIDPGHYPLSGERWESSDVNQDGRPGTIGDLIRLVSIVTGGDN